jgi:hypothetical protein
MPFKLCVIPAKAGIQRRMSMRRISNTARGRLPLDPRFHGEDTSGLIAYSYLKLEKRGVLITARKR